MKEESLYIVRTDDLRQVEQDSIDAGHSAQNYMQKAAEGIAHIIHLYRHKHFLSNTVLAVVGKGNNGGDAIATALELQRQGMKVHVLLTCSMEELSVLTHHYLTKYIKKRKGKVFLEKPSTKEMKHIDLIIDGYLGSGIKGKPKTLEWIEWMNSCCQKKIAIDVPSGLNEENTNSVHADVTVALECYKDIHLTTQGYEQCGTLEMVPFGLPHAFQKTLTPVAYMVNPERLFSTVSPMKKTQHKYERGYLVVYAGSYANVGCRELVAHAALRTGAGMVRALLHEEDTSELHPIELVSTQFRDTEAVDREVERAKALAIGPGIGKEERAFKALCSLLEKTQIPVVLDADALYRFHDIPSHLTANRTILTPHEGELSYLFTKGENLIEQCAQFAKEHQVILVKKGAPTWIFFPNHKPMVSTYADPGMATAGSGDVLTGIIGAFLAQGVALEDAAPLGVYVHGICGIKAAMQLGSRSVMAHDLVTFLPEVLAHTQTQ